ncbi:chaperonin 10-like protein [Schizophyllum amplum]|uniref:Chaperonin 10-like protein n=1 Tax=Schizophyllum amplum TaxID=97359 RepID=A0A550CWG0_9AGAR|nr:chaperonin 10-like protein [Auriculariopsis ampla]
MSALPESIKALQVLPDLKGVQVVTIPWASQEKVQNLADNEIIIRVRAVGLNPTDWKHAMSQLGRPGAISGCDAAGDVVKVGAAVKHLKVGDRAAGFTYGGSWQKDNGAFAEYARFAGAVCFKLPDDMTYEEASSFPIPHLTAVRALYMRLGLPKPDTKAANEKILIWGGSTAVGHHTIQLAKLSGLTVFVTASPGAHEELKALGADHCFDYKDTDVVSKITSADGGADIIYGVDAVTEKDTTDLIVDAMSKTRGGTIITTLPISNETKNRRADVSVEFMLVYTELGYELTVANAAVIAALKEGGKSQDVPKVLSGWIAVVAALKEDEERTLEYVLQDMPKVLSGWKAGQGAPKFKTQRLRKMQGGLDNIGEGLKIMAEGNYGREKLVYTIA